MPANQHLLDAEMLEIRKAYLDPRYALFQAFLRPQTFREVVEKIFAKSFPGATDLSALSLIGTMCMLTQPSRVLDFGTFCGFSTLVLADLLSTNDRSGHIVTVEPDGTAQTSAMESIERVGLQDAVTFVTGFSTDPHIASILRQLGPFDMMYIDSSHSYEATRQELDMYLGHSPIVRSGGLVFLHDVTLDMGANRGVGAAVDDWLSDQTDFRYLPLTVDGTWPNLCGLGILLVP
jgi:predicted O-methyltransferase YrrM